MAGGAKKKKKAQAEVKCLCSATKGYKVGGEEPSQLMMEELAPQSGSVTDAQIATIGKSKVIFKPTGGEKVVPKIPYKGIVELRQFNTDLKVCVVRAEKKKVGILVVLKFSTEDECKNFISLVKGKNSKVMVSRSTTRTRQTVHDTLVTQREPNGTAALPISPSPVLPYQSSPISTKQQPLNPSIAHSPSDHSKLVSTSSTKPKVHTDLQHPYNTETSRIEAVTTTSSWSVLFISRGTSPPSVSIHQQQTSQVQKKPLISRGTEMINQRKKSSSSSLSLSRAPDQQKLESDNRMSQRYPKRSSSSQSLKSHSLGRHKKSNPRSRKKHKNTRKSFSSSSFRSHDKRRQNPSTMRNRHGSLHRRKLSVSSNSSFDKWIRQNKIKSANHVRGLHNVSLSISSSYSSSEFKERDKSKPRNHDGQSSKVNQRRRGNKRDIVRSSSVDLSSFSLMRISASQKSITSLHSFGVSHPFTTTILSHRLSSSTSSRSKCSRSVSTSSWNSNESGISFVSNSVSEVTQRTRSLHSSYHDQRHKHLRGPSLQISRVR
ncbi:expressed protein [Echinococcus multilocularis]|uniref:Expressed protein n=1 Tax=Echinococcus multilocularis TaxID=6211 RepID=A0A068YCI7_ECHMU|nr:expressed protein [Echinococcus multilocularis]